MESCIRDVTARQRYRTGWPVCVLLLIFCTHMAGQVMFPQNRTRGNNNDEYASQLVTANALRAPKRARQALEKAEAAFQHHQPQAAEDQLARALGIYPDYAQALTLRAIVKMTSDRPTAISDLQHAISVDPSYGAAYAVLASVYNDSQQYADALASANKAVQFLPKAWPVHYEIARATFALSGSQAALGEINEAIWEMSADAGASAESRASVHYLCAIILIAQHEFSEAKRELERTVNEQPGGALVKPSSDFLAQLRSGGN